MDLVADKEKFQQPAAFSAPLTPVVATNNPKENTADDDASQPIETQNSRKESVIYFSDGTVLHVHTYSIDCCCSDRKRNF